MKGYYPAKAASKHISIGAIAAISPRTVIPFQLQPLDFEATRSKLSKTASPKLLHQNCFTKTASPKLLHQNYFNIPSINLVQQNSFNKIISIHCFNKKSTEVVLPIVIITNDALPRAIVYALKTIAKQPKRGDRPPARHHALPLPEHIAILKWYGGNDFWVCGHPYIPRNHYPLRTPAVLNTEMG